MNIHGLLLERVPCCSIQGCRLLLVAAADDDDDEKQREAEQVGRYSERKRERVVADVGCRNICWTDSRLIRGGDAVARRGL